MLTAYSLSIITIIQVAKIKNVINYWNSEGYNINWPSLTWNCNRMHNKYVRQGEIESKNHSVPKSTKNGSATYWNCISCAENHFEQNSNIPSAVGLWNRQSDICITQVFSICYSRHCLSMAGIDLTEWKNKRFLLDYYNRKTRNESTSWSGKAKLNIAILLLRTHGMIPWHKME